VTFGKTSYCESRSWPGTDRRPLGAICVYVSLLLLPAVGCTARDPAVAKAESVRQGDELMAKKQYAQAAAAYRVAIENDPLDGHVRMALAKAYVSAENWPLAGPEAVRAADLLPDSIDAQLQAAELLLGPGWYVDAAERAAAVLQQQPENISALMILGNAKARLRSSALALFKLDEAVRLGGDEERVRADLRSNVSSSDDRAAEEAFRKAVRIDPTHLSAQIALANFLWATRRADEAEQPLKFVAEREQSGGFTNRVLGGFYLSRHRLAEAEKHLKTAAMLGDREVRLTLADLYIEAHRDDDAISILNSMTPGEDTSGEVSLRMASIEFRSNKRDEAMRRLDAFLARAPRNPRAVLLEAQFLFAT
jgi:tetratricopeptide (TPR) repeat protein